MKTLFFGVIASLLLTFTLPNDIWGIHFQSTTAIVGNEHTILFQLTTNETLANTMNMKHLKNILTVSPTAKVISNIRFLADIIEIVSKQERGWIYIKSGF